MTPTGKPYASVSDMVHALSTPEFAADFDAHVEQRRIISALMVRRAAWG